MNDIFSTKTPYAYATNYGFMLVRKFKESKSDPDIQDYAKIVVENADKYMEFPEVVSYKGTDDYKNQTRNLFTLEINKIESYRKFAAKVLEYKDNLTKEREEELNELANKAESDSFKFIDYFLDIEKTIPRRDTVEERRKYRQKLCEEISQSEE